MATVLDSSAATAMPAFPNKDPATASADAPGPTKLDTTTEPFPAAAATTSSPTHLTSANGIPSKDDTNPLDFQGDVQTNNKLPSPETLQELEKYTVLDESGKSHPFKSLYTGPNVARRVLIIFIRHFFCGVSACPHLITSTLSWW